MTEQVAERDLNFSWLQARWASAHGRKRLPGRSSPFRKLLGCSLRAPYSSRPATLEGCELVVGRKIDQHAVHDDGPALLHRRQRRGGAVPLNGTEDAASAIRRMATADLRAAYGRARLEEKVPTWLEPNEAVLALANCTLAGRWWQEASPRRIRLIVATDRRLLLLPFGLLMADDLVGEAQQPEPDSLAYAEIKEIEEKRAWWESKLEVRTKGREVLLTSLRKKSASAIADAIRDNLSSGSRASRQLWS